MNCTSCGKPLADGAKFCPYCGARAEQPQQSEKFCSACGNKLEAGAQFCPSCGVKVGQTPNSAPVNPPITEQNRPVGTGRLLFAAKMFSMYEGTPAIGVAKASGPLTVYDDRIEFKKQMGNAMGGAFGLVGMAIAKNKVKNDPINIYPVNQIAQVRVGKYGGVYNTLVIVMKDSTTVSFCPALPASSDPQNIVNSLLPYLR